MAEYEIVWCFVFCRFLFSFAIKKSKSQGVKNYELRKYENLF